MQPVSVRIVKFDDDSQVGEFLFDNVSWKIPNDGLENWGNTLPEVSSMELAGMDGGIVTNRRINMIDRSISAVYVGNNYEKAHQQAVKFFNPNYYYEAHVTYYNKTLWAPCELYKYQIKTGNIYEKPTIDVTFLFPMPFLLSEDDFGKDVAGVTPHFGFPLYSYVWKDVAFQEVEAHAPKARLWNTPLPNSEAVTQMMNMHRTVTFEGDLTLFRTQPQGIPSPNNCSVFLHNQSTGEMYKLFQLEDTSWTNVPKVFNVTVDVNEVLAQQIVSLGEMNHNEALHYVGALDLTQFTLKAFGWQSSANGRPTVADAEFIMRASIGSLDGANPYPEIYPRGFITGVYDYKGSVSIDNDGDVPTKLHVYIEASGQVTNPIIRLVDSRGNSRQVGFIAMVMQEGDWLDVDFTQTPPTVLMNGENVTNKIDKTSDFISFDVPVGHSIFEYGAWYGKEFMSVRLFWNKRYLGV